MTKNMCLVFTRKWDSASDTEIVWAKSVHRVHHQASTVHRAPNPQCYATIVHYHNTAFIIQAPTMPFGFYLSPSDIQPHPTPRWTPSVVAWPMAEAANPCPFSLFLG